MNFKDAMEIAKIGKPVRCDDYMSPGWSITWIPQVEGFFCINPVTRSNYRFLPESRDRNSTNWRIANVLGTHDGDRSRRPKAVRTRQ